ncbi:hypothetical protein C8J56DRAFT_934774 [Mycena floridula]|nr:hypothetical protein C8J56DRAFT_934774 [Mycena floridula]
MARATLNPASMPFFPGGIRSNDDEGPVFRSSFHNGELDRGSAASVGSDYRSSKSSPSPPRDERAIEPNSRRQQPSPPVDSERRSPTFRHFDANRPYPPVENRIPRESSMLGSLESLPESEDNQDTPGPDSQPPSSFFPLQQSREPFASSTPPVAINHSGSSYNNTGAFASSSPVSSLDSGSHFTLSSDVQPLSFETQLKGSPMIHEILDRLVRCEYSTREIQRDLGDVQRKVNLLVERSLGVSSQPAQPEFKDPFAGSNGTSFSTARPSLANIAPNQPAPSDDITTISQRLNTLTSSVGQLLAIQTQQLQSSAGLNAHPLIGSGPQLDAASPPMISGQAMLGHGLPPRSDMRPAPRIPNPPMRTWSTGTLDIPLRQSDPNIGRTDQMSRDKRRSVSGLMRRDSAGMLDLQNGDRDGPLVSKWEQLSLAPDLQRSLSKFGVGPPNKIQQRALPFLLRGADIIAQAPPTQERIAAYVIPAIQIALTHMSVRTPNRGPIVIMISTTVDQATQAQRMIRDLGGPIGVRSALGVGATSANSDLSQELRLLQQNMPHVICGTPQKLHALFTATGGLLGSEVRFLVLDEVDQLIARNLHEFVFTIVKLLPTPRSRPLGAGQGTGNTTPSSSTPATFSSLETGNPNPSSFQNSRRFSSTPNPDSNPAVIERQTALFSNTVPQDVLNLATAIQLREPVRVLVRRDGTVTHTDSVQGARGLRQYYLYLAFTAGGRLDPTPAAPGGGLGIIGSGRGATSAESVQAREWKLDALADLLDDVEVTQAIVHVGGMTSLDSVVYKLASRGVEAVPLHGDMAAPTKLAALNKYRGASNVIRQPSTKVLVVYDVQIKDIPQVPLIINYDLPKAVEEYAHRVAPAIAPNNFTRAGVVVNFVTATGGDVEMLRSIECFYKIKCPEVPMSLRDIV